MKNLRKTVIPIMLLGDYSTEKTSILLKLTGNEINDSQLTTVGKESYILPINLHGYDLKIKLWDTAGQERYKSMSVQVLKNSDGIVLVYSVNDRYTFNSIDQWLLKLNETSDLSEKCIIIIGNKVYENERSREVSYEEGKKYAENKGYNFYEVSSKTGENIKEAFNDIIEQIYIKFEFEITGKRVKRGKRGKRVFSPRIT